MNLALFLTAIAVLLISGAAAVLAGRSHRLATLLGAGGALVGCALGIAPAFHVLIDGEALFGRIPWNVPYGSFAVGIDPLSAFFLIPLFGLSACAALYATEYLDHGSTDDSPGTPWFFFNALVASMALVITARNGVLFLVVWELMSLASFFLVTAEDRQESVRRAGWVYLIATHAGTMFLLALFIGLGRGAAVLDFDRFGAGAALAPGMASLLFLFALIGFGTKAGIAPFHIWLPEAHPAAPSHVSAVMSGVMIKTGIYGLVRTLMFLGPPPAWWGGTLVAIGAVSGIGGILYALAQNDLKRLLAYSSVENVGLITLGLGLGLVGISLHLPAMAALGFAGAFFHLFNHALFKGLLFLGAGSVLRRTGTLDLNLLGGLHKRMPWTGTAFLVGAAAITGLPPLNGFASEFLLYLSAGKGFLSLSGFPALLAAGVIIVLALIGGLAAACFAKAFGMVFLGEPRTDAAAQARECGPAMRAPMALLAGVCALTGLAAPLAVVPVFKRVLAGILTIPSGAAADLLTPTVYSLTLIAVGSLILVGLVGALILARRGQLHTRTVGETGTWDCGYAQPTARMQYTGSSFSRPLTRLFRLVLAEERDEVPVDAYAPRAASRTTRTPDVLLEKIYDPLFNGVRRVVSNLRVLQEGRVQVYILYIAGTLLALLIWKLR